MSNSLWRDASPGGPYGGGPGAAPRGRDARVAAGLPGMPRREAGGGRSAGFPEPPGARAASGSQESPGRARWGSLPGGLGVGIIAVSAVLGAIATVAARTEPGPVLGASVVVGTAAAGLAVRPRAGRMIFPVPALCYLIAALAAGIVYDRSADSSGTALAIGAVQWIANGFFAMAIATALAIVLTAVRWFIWRRRRGPAVPGWPAPTAGNSPWPQADTEGLAVFGVRGDMRGPGGRSDPASPATRRLPGLPQGQRLPGPPGAQGPDRRLGQFAEQGPGRRRDQREGPSPEDRSGRRRDERGGPFPEERSGRRRDQRGGPQPGSGPYNFSSGA